MAESHALIHGRRLSRTATFVLIAGHAYPDWAAGGGLDLKQASPAAALRGVTIPVLLIHGTNDRNIPMRHSEELHRLNPGATRLSIVPGATHAVALSVCPEEYVRTVLEWFEK